jgi:outer membrane protein, heavy metal efflux system
MCLHGGDESIINIPGSRLFSGLPSRRGHDASGCRAERVKEKRMVKRCKLRFATLVGMLLIFPWGTVLASSPPAPDASQQAVAAAEAPALAPGDPIDLDRSVEIALESNPGVEAMRRRYEGMLERPDQDRALPDPMVAYAFMFKDVVTANGPSMGILEVSQEFPFVGKRPLRAGVSRSEAEAAEQAWRTARLQVAYEVRSAYYRLYRIDRSVEIVLQEADVLNRLERVARTRYATGIATQGDVFRAQTERSRIDERLIQLRREREAVAARFNAALNRPRSEPVGPALTPPTPVAGLPPEDELERLAREARPEILEAERLLEASRQRIGLAQRDYYPDFRVTFQWNRIGSTENPFAPNPGQDAYMAMVGVNLPIWRKKLRAGVREAESMRAMAESEVRDRNNTVGSEVHAMVAMLRMRGELVTLYERTLIPQAESTLLAAEVAYRTGRVDFLSVLDSERSILDLRLAHAMALADLGEALSGLERAVGRDLNDRATLGRPASPPDGGQS